ncbi:transglycosylase SLT domain-containing protein [Ditylenchus destructor]|nr:transglycosylase SLT domain-containing protein [Ditylenchus destructor]
MQEAAEKVRICSCCGNVDTSDPCTICTDARRDPTTLIVVEDVSDLWALERAGTMNVRYHVLGGRLSPLDGIARMISTSKGWSSALQRVTSRNPSKAQVESQYRNWIEKDLWPEAKAAGVRALFLSRLLQELRSTGSCLILSFRAKSQQRRKNRNSGVRRAGQILQCQNDWFCPQAAAKRGLVRMQACSKASSSNRRAGPHRCGHLGARCRALARSKFRTMPLNTPDHLTRLHPPMVLMKSSWAGALGQPQFMPTSYLKHAVDFDGDGKRDIWNSVPDTLGSIANYLKIHGWQAGRDWGYEVNVPPEYFVFSGRARPGQDICRMGKAWYLPHQRQGVSGQ